MDIGFLHHLFPALPGEVTGPLSALSVIALGAVIPSISSIWGKMPWVQRGRAARTQTRSLGSQLRVPKQPGAPPNLPKGKKPGWFRRSKGPKDTTIRDLKRLFRHQVERLAGSPTPSFIPMGLRNKSFLYERPWYLMVGESGSGKTTLLANSTLVNSSAPIREDFPAEASCGWWESDQAVVLDITGDYLLRKDGSANLRGWKTVLRLLRRYRDQRPIDGLLLAIPATDLTGDAQLDSEAITRKAEAIAERLRDVERDLGMCVPVYPVITWCDEIVGFTDFCNQLPAHRLQEMFGWSNPYALETGYTDQWVEEAFTSMSTSIYPTQLEMFSASNSGTEGDRLFLFPTEFGSIAQGVQSYVDPVFRSSGYHTITLLLRGLYFAGDRSIRLGATAAQSIPELELITSGLPSAVTPESLRSTRPIAFVKDLLSYKIFAEHGIGYPLSRNRFAKNRLVFLVQLLIAAVIIFAGVAWFVDYPQLDRSATVLTHTLDTIYSDLQQLQGREKYNENEDTVYVSYAQHILEGLSRNESNRLTTPLFPSSWFSPLHNDIKRAMAKAYEKVILKAMKVQLHGKGLRIPADGVAMAAATAIDTTNNWAYLLDNTEEFKNLQRYVRNLHDLETHYRLFNNLKKTQDLQDVRRLVRYLFGKDLSDEFLENGAYYRAAINYVEISPFNPDNYRGKAVEAARLLLEQLQNRMFTRNVILQGVRDINSDLRYLATNSGGGIEGVDRLSRLGRNISNLKEALLDPRTQWISKPSFVPDSSLQRLLQGIDSSVFLRHGNPDLVQSFNESCAIKFRSLLQDILLEESDVIGPIVRQPMMNRPIALVTEVDSLRSAILGLLGQKFMRERKFQRIASQRTGGNIVLWNTEGLSEAQKLNEPYTAFIDGALGSFPASLQNAIRNVARTGLEMTMTSVIVPSQRPQSRLSEPDDYQREIQSLVTARPVLEKLLGVLDQLQVGSYSDLRGALNQQGNLLLKDLYSYMGRSVRYYDDQLLRSSILSYKNKQINGEAVLLGAELFYTGDDASMMQYLGERREQIAQINNDFVVPILSFMSAIGASRSDILNSWIRISTELKKHESKTPGNSVSVMEDLFVDLNNINESNYSSRLLPRGDNNFFLSVREGLRKPLKDMFDGLVVEKARKGYQDLQERFTNQLQNRSPFVDSMANPYSTPSVGIDELRTYLNQVDDFLRRYRGIVNLWEKGSPRERDAVGFLQRMSKIGYYLAPVLGNDSIPPGSLIFNVDFRPAPILEAGYDQIIDRRLVVGRDEYSIEDQFRQGGVPLRATWAPGSRIRLGFRWAQNATSIPLMAPPLPWLRGTMQIEPDMVTYSYNDAWSLLRLMNNQRYRADRTDRRNDARTMTPHMMEFAIETVSAATATSFGTTQQSTLQKLYVRISVIGRDKREVLALPEFPTFAPPL